MQVVGIITVLWAILPTPLNQSGTVRGRAVAQYEQGDSYTDLLSKEKLSLLLSAEADLSENTLLSGGVTYQEDDPRGPMWEVYLSGLVMAQNELV